ncbi:MAG: tol-pal system protein YbgF [Rhizobiaceae bacterium]|nr:tol-pal system protein YbgF [Rhizobiaceae bacterium]
MYFRTILSGTLAALLLSATATIASERGGADHLDQRPVAAPMNGLPGVFSNDVQQQPLLLAQASDPRVVSLEEQVRALNGTIEELNFQVLQLQEQLRKMQEDNEFRFQELEKRGDAGGKKDRTVASAPAAAPPEASAAQPGTVDEVIAGDTTSATQPGADGTLGAPPKTFGSLSVDENGNVIEEGAVAPSDGAAVAALPPSNDPEELYRNSYQFILSGDYAIAESGFRQHIERFPQDGRAADAHFWLGESLLGQKKYRDAAETFLNANKQYPKSKKAADMLLKLGISLIGLNQREVACATFGEVGKRYPNASAALKDRVKQEQARAAC